MNQLQKTSNNLPAKAPLTAPAISGIAFNILKTLQDPMVKDINDDELFLYCKKAVVAAYADTGYSIPGETEEDQQKELDYQINTLQRDVRIMYPTLRPNEIVIAISNGVRGMYGEFYGISPVTLISFVKSYTMDTERISALRALHEPVECTNEVTDNDKIRIAQECVREAYFEFKKNGFFEDYGNAVGNALKRLGLFTYSNDEIQALMTRAESTLRAKLAAEVQKSREKTRKEEILYRLEMLNSKNDSAHVMLRKEAAKLAVTDKFREWSAAGINIDEILN